MYQLYINDVWVFGSNSHGQLGLNDPYHCTTPTLIQACKADQIAYGQYHIIIIDLNYNVWTFGLNSQGQLG